MHVTSKEMDALIDLVEELCGLYLDETKAYLIETRLEPVAEQQNCENLGDFVALARQVGQAALREQIVDSITTNETLFFRDNSPFDALRFKLLPEVVDRVEAGDQPRRLRIWSAGCSTGQEPYSIAMTLHDLIPDIESWDISILASDVSRAAIEKAKSGTYSELEMSRGLQSSVLQTYFTRTDETWNVREEIRRLVDFEVRNLLDSFAERDYFDFVFCRNVAIYFKKQQQDDVFRRIVDTIVPGGYLFVGSAESLSHLGVEFTPQIHCNCTLYCPKERARLSQP